MKSRILNFLLLFFSLFGYLEWGGNNHAFLFEIELEIVSKFLTNPVEVIHPLILLPLIGQAILIISIFQKSPSKTLTYFGLAGLGSLFVFIFIIGILSLNLKVLISTLPFLIVAITAIRNLIKGKSANS